MDIIKNMIKKIPVLRDIFKAVYFAFSAPSKEFKGSKEYWKQRYRAGGNSGAGSYDRLAEFKSEVLNNFIRDRGITTIIEYGCGDGNQLRLAEYPSYIGFDVSSEAIARCDKLFSHDEAKTFGLMDEYVGQTAQLTMSLDVIYHLIEDEVYLSYMERLFDSSAAYVVVYSTNTNKQSNVQAVHVKHRQFSEWVDRNRPEWVHAQYIPNRYSDEQQGTAADFHIYEKS